MIHIIQKSYNISKNISNSELCHKSEGERREAEGNAGKERDRERYKGLDI